MSQLFASGDQGGPAIFLFSRPGKHRSVVACLTMVYGMTVTGDLTMDSNFSQPSSDQAWAPFCALNFPFVEWGPPWRRADCDNSLECYLPRIRYRAGLI